MPGFLLQTVKQLLALWCHRLRCGDHFSLNQSQHLWGRKGMGEAAWSHWAPSLRAPALPRPFPNSHLTSAGLRHRRVLLAELPLMSRRTCSCVSSWATTRPPRWAAFTFHLPASGPAIPFAQVLLPLGTITLGLSPPPEAQFWILRLPASLALHWALPLPPRPASHHQLAPVQDPLLFGLKLLQQKLPPPSHLLQLLALGTQGLELCPQATAPEP